MENGNKPLTAEERIKERINQIALEKSSSPSDWGWIERYMIEGYEIAKEEFANQPKPVVSDIEKAGIIAVNIVSNVEPRLTAKEESFFIAGFTECVKYYNLYLQSEGNGSEWISVEERLPELGQTIWENRDLGERIKVSESVWTESELKCYKMNCITHWKPLIKPEPFTQSKNQK